MKRFLINLILVFLFLFFLIVILLPIMSEIKIKEAKMFEKRYRWKTADRTYNKAVSMMPFNADLFREYGDFLIRQSTYRKDKISKLKVAEKVYKQAVGLNSKATGYLVALGGIQIELFKNILQTDSGKAEQAINNLEKAAEEDPNGFNTLYLVGYTAIELWSKLKDVEKEFVLDVAKRSMFANPWFAGRFVYPRAWEITGDFKVLQNIAGERLAANINLYYFMAENNLWQFRKEQAEIINFCKQKENPKEVDREKQAKIEQIEELKRMNMNVAETYENIVVAPDQWQGKSINGINIYKGGRMAWGGTMNGLINVPEGRSTISIQACGKSAKGIWPYMIVELDGELIGEMFVNSNEYDGYTFDVSTKKGLKVLSVTFLNDFYDEESGEDRNLSIGEARIILEE